MTAKGPAKFKTAMKGPGPRPRQEESVDLESVGQTERDKMLKYRK